jgi:hypothetical protein
MELIRLPRRSWAAALAVGILSIMGIANAQQFTDVTLGHEAYPELSEQCYKALNTTVQSCPGFLAAYSFEMPRLVPYILEALYTPGYRSSLVSVRGVIASGYADTDVIEMGRVVYLATYMIDHIIHAYDVSCIKDSDTGIYYNEIYLDNLANGTMADSCSDYTLKVGSILLNSLFNYNAGFYSDF